MTTLVEVVKTGDSVSVFGLSPGDVTPVLLAEYDYKTPTQVIEVVEMLIHIRGVDVTLVTSSEFHKEVKARCAVMSPIDE